MAISSFYHAFFPQVSDSHKPECISGEAWSGIKKSRYLACALTWLQVACVVAGLAFTILLGPFFGAEFKAAIGVLTTSSTMVGGGAYFFPVEIFTVPIGLLLLGLVGFQVAIPALLGFAAAACLFGVA